MKMVTLESAIVYGESQQRAGYWRAFRYIPIVGVLCSSVLVFIFTVIRLFVQNTPGELVGIAGSIFGVVLVIAFLVLAFFVNKKEQSVRCAESTFVVPLEDIRAMQEAGVPDSLIPRPTDTDAIFGTDHERVSVVATRAIIQRLLKTE